MDKSETVEPTNEWVQEKADGAGTGLNSWWSPTHESIQAGGKIWQQPEDWMGMGMSMGMGMMAQRAAALSLHGWYEL